MKHTLAIESIGDDVAGMATVFSRMADSSLPGSGRYFSVGAIMPWVAEITGLNERGQLRRKFLRPHKDYSQANSVGSRGVWLYYALTAGRVYEVKERLSWKRSHRYFCRFVKGEKEILTLEQVKCLISSAESE